MSSRKLEDLNTKTEDLARKFLAACSAAGIDVLIYCTYRSIEEQNDLYAVGRTLPGKKATNAKGGNSWHNHRAAFDFVPMIAGKPQWSNAALYVRCGAIAESVGLEWAGRWVSFKETAHCQYTGGLTLKQAKEQK